MNGRRMMKGWFLSASAWLAVAAAQGSTIYVSHSGLHVAPYDTWANASTSLNVAAQSAGAGSTVWVTNSAAPYYLAGTIVNSNGFTIRGFGEASEVVIHGGHEHRCFDLDHTNAALIGLTITAGYRYNENGGGILLGRGTVRDCIIVSNRVESYASGGGVYMRRVFDQSGQDVAEGGRVLDSSVLANDADDYGGGIFCNQAGGMISNVLVRGHTNALGSGVYLWRGSLLNSEISENADIAVFMGGSNALVRACDISNNQGTGIQMSGGELHTSQIMMNDGRGVALYEGLEGSNVVTGCHIFMNAGGGVLFGISTRDSIVEHSTIAMNMAEGDGGGVCMESRGTLRNCLIARNNAGGLGGGIHTRQYASAHVINCTIIENRAMQGGGIHITGDVYLGNHYDLRNNIIYHNHAYLGQNYFIDSNDVEFFNTCTWPPAPGQNNIDGDPHLDDHVIPHVLLPASPCIDAGANMDWMTGATDVDGNPRIYNGTVDIGAYEFTPGPLTADFTASARQGFSPLAVVFTAVAVGTNVSGITYAWDFDNNGEADAFGAVVTNIFTNYGHADIRLTAGNAAGETNSLLKDGFVKIGPSALYAAAGGSNTFPYASWATAATDLDDALRAAVDGSVVHLTSQVYELTASVDILDGVRLLGNGNRASIIDGMFTTRCVVVRHPAAVLENLTIRNGVGDEERNEDVGIARGGGVLLEYGGSLVNCAVLDNRVNTRPGQGSTAQGGGIYAAAGGMISNCLVAGNTAPDGGGGIYARHGTLVTHSEVTGNSHGGVYLVWGGEVRNSTVGNNTGRGVYCEQDGYVRDSFIHSSTNGPGVWLHRGGGVSSSTISNNYNLPAFGGEGGGVFAYKGGVVSNCLIIANTARTGGGVRLDEGGLLVESIIENNRADASGSGVFVNRSGTVYRCEIRNNTNSAGLYLYQGGQADRCTVAGNSASFGGGIRFQEGGRVYNTLVHGNRADSSGGGVYFYHGGELHNSTVVDNLARWGGGVYFWTNGLVANSIMYDNRHITNFSVSNYGHMHGGALYRHTCTQPAVPTGYDGGGNIADPPAFRNAAARDYRLSAASPCINAGTNLPWMVSALDLDGSPRIHNGIVDMGAFEWPGVPPAPALLDPANVTAQGFTLRWNESDSALTYYLDIALDSAFSSLLPGYDNRDVGDVTQWQVNLSGPWQGPYFYRIRAGNALGLGPYSETGLVQLRSGVLSWLLLLLGN